MVNKLKNYNLQIDQKLLKFINEDVLKEFLTHRKIVFEKGSWESFD